MDFEKMSADELAALVSPEMAAELLTAVYGEAGAREVVEDAFWFEVHAENARAGRSGRR